MKYRPILKTEESFNWTWNFHGYQLQLVSALITSQATSTLVTPSRLPHATVTSTFHHCAQKLTNSYEQAGNGPSTESQILEHDYTTCFQNWDREILWVFEALLKAQNPYKNQFNTISSSSVEKMVPSGFSHWDNLSVVDVVGEGGAPRVSNAVRIGQYSNL